MPYVLVRNEVEDFAKWKAVFDQHAAFRENYGSLGYQLFNSVDNPNEVFILFEWDTVAHAQQFTSSDELRQAMQKAGVISRPDAFFMNAVGEGDA